MAISLVSSAASPAGFQEADSLVPPSATPAWPRAAARAPTGTRRNVAPPGSRLWTCPARGCVAPSVSAAAIRRQSELRGLIDQHDGNVVFDRIDQAALVADEFFLRCLLVLQCALALRAHEDFQEFNGQAHIRSLEGVGKPNRARIVGFERHLGKTLTRSSRYTGRPSSPSIRLRA